MKELITASDVQRCREKEEKIMYTDSKALVTPAARDLASEMGIRIIHRSQMVETEPEKEHTSSVPERISGNIDIAQISKLVIEALAVNAIQSSAPVFVKESDSSGLRLIRGNTVKCAPFDTGNQDAKVGLTDILNTRESRNLGAGFMTIEQSEFEWFLGYEEVDVILEGTLEITIDGKTYRGYAGDVFYIPKGKKITWRSPDRARFFYATYPANWSELA